MDAMAKKRRGAAEDERLGSVGEDGEGEEERRDEAGSRWLWRWRRLESISNVKVSISSTL